jgi:NAD(P)-dependent dehydrogenase (short-subunit alcohol dehydrogenase family)
MLSALKKVYKMSFKNKTVFITGASRGIGLAIGKRLAREGANIVILQKQQNRIRNYPVRFIRLLPKSLPQVVKHYLLLEMYAPKKVFKML